MTKLPVVLHHGFFGFGGIGVGRLKVSYFVGIDRAIINHGHPLVITRVHPTGGIERRARELKASILRQLRAQGREKSRVMIFAHSMGGLDARYMIAKLGMDDRVAALVTVGTPHRGTPYADYLLRNLGQRLGALNVFNLFGLDVQGWSDLTTASCAAFNDTVRDSPIVRYYSVSGARPWHRVPPFAIHSHRVVTEAEGENDSLVSVCSSRWGEHLGVWPADHWHLINRRLVLELRDPTGDITPYYDQALHRLSRDGALS